MTIHDIIEREIFCACSRCEGAVQDILRMERMLCYSARSILGRRRGLIRQVRKSEKDRARYEARIATTEAA